MRSPPLFITAASSISARPECTSALPRTLPLRGTPPTCAPTSSRSIAQLADVNVEAGKDRPFLGARLELRQADQRHAVGGQAVDRQLVVEPRARRPIELDVGRSQEHSVLVGDGDVPQLRLAEDRPVDPPDTDVQARRGLEPRNAIDDEAVAGRAVEQDERASEQEQQSDEGGEQLIEQPPLPIPPEPPSTAAPRLRS